MPSQKSKEIDSEMYAIVDIAGQQMKVEKDQKLYVHRLQGEEGSQVTFEKVLLLDQDDKISVGQPIVNGVSITAKIIAHVSGDKVLVFKKKRRKGYQKLNGHRQQFSQIQIEDIVTGSARKTSKAKAEKPVEAEAPVIENPEVEPTTEN